MEKAPVVLIIRDGWGVNPGGKETAERDGNSVELSSLPFHDHLWGTYPKGSVSASGLDVGLPDGQMGNSEVGHLNLGAGRIVYQSLTRINKSIVDNELGKQPALTEAFAKLKTGGRLHLVGLVSDGGVHSHQDHLVALAKEAKLAGVNDILVHAITDGRDCSPTSGTDCLKAVAAPLAEYGAKIVTVVGRYYAMDRDTRWERNKLAWDAIFLGKGESTTLTPSEAVAAKYEEKITDEFMTGLIFDEPDQQRVNDGDVVLFFNYRADRARQMSEAILKGDQWTHFEKEVHPDVHLVTTTQYDSSYKCGVIFPPSSMKNVLGEVVSAAGLKQLRIAETEKYPHVTYFFNGGEENAYDGEDRMIVPSPKVATYDLQPEMNAPEVTQKVVEQLKNYDLVILNFANPDMVGHTGIIEACIKACETIDASVKAVTDETLRLGGKLLITADHGNCELLQNPDGSPHTAHTTNLVHAIYVAADHANIKVKDGILADIAPTLLSMLGVNQPEEMTGKSLID